MKNTIFSIIITLVLLSCDEKKSSEIKIKECFNIRPRSCFNDTCTNYLISYYNIENYNESCLEKLDFGKELKKIIAYHNRNGKNDTILSSVTFVKSDKIGFDPENRCKKKDFEENAIVEFFLSKENSTIEYIILGSKMGQPVHISNINIIDSNKMQPKPYYILATPYIEE